MEKLVLTGNNLTIEEVVQVAKNFAPVEISSEAKERLIAGRQLVFDLVDADFPIYGFNVGVGWNKDRKVFKEFFAQYNANLIRSHSIGVPPYASIEDTRAVMLARLGTMLVGCTGVAPEIPEMYAEMLNKGIHPLIPERGSVGEGDIGLLSHIGLAIIGEGEVIYNGKQMPSTEAFERAGLKPLTLGPKDGLAIVSSNAMGAGQAAIVLKEVENLLKMADVIYALSLEGVNGSIAPLDERIQRLRRYTGQQEIAKNVLGYLQGSYLFGTDRGKAVHDPLCFRDYSQVHGAVREMLEYAKERLEIQLNTTEDNPCLLLEERTIVPSANFEPLNWVLPIESLSIAMSHVSRMSCYRILKLSDPTFTNLPRFLSPAVDVLGFATVQKTFSALDAEIRHLCNTSSMDSFSLAGDMEDRGCNTTYVVQNLRKITDNLRYIFALEMIHAAQAIDYRKGKSMGIRTSRLHEAIRERISFYDKDRNITKDILAMYDLITGGKILDFTK